MKTKLKLLSRKIFTFFAVAVMGLCLLPSTFNTTPAYAADQAQTVILGDCAKQENGHGEGIKCIVLLVADILAVLVGIVGVIGIVVVGIQYLTAGGNEEQVRKAKRRLFEIIIGIVVYVLIYSLLKWLLPGFAPETNNTSHLPSTINTIGRLPHLALAALTTGV